MSIRLGPRFLTMGLLVSGLSFGASALAADPAPSLPTTDPAATAQKDLSKEEEEAKMEAMRAEKKRLELEQALERQRQERELSKLEAERKAILTRIQLDEARRKLELSRLQAETDRLTAERRAAEQELALEQLRVKRAVTKLESEQQVLTAKRKARQHVAEDIQYRANPFHDGVLEITDRRIPLNGPITMATADAITQKLHFFNNQSQEHPVFIVIDYSPGGSVMAGYRILEAMEASEAPVHVVVKSFAASMAAVITTRAPHSYAYPNAVILHHQISSGNGGNLTQQAERLEEAAEWSKRLLGPVHQKMGISHDELVKRMYEKDSGGDWKAFADEAQKLRWVDHLVDDVREVGVSAIDDDLMKRGPRADATESQKLPRLLPSDHWFLYDPDGYYH
ncbi:MAG: ATP-dependent Clp protease proteolytic subunit [Myxococcales bacterium]|nr:ATP-dependent Clp protease proteolytic subunit [Myxococcales bacterium]